jgi:hypothetical protein
VEIVVGNRVLSHGLWDETGHRVCNDVVTILKTPRLVFHRNPVIPKLPVRKPSQDGTDSLAGVYIKRPINRCTQPRILDTSIAGREIRSLICNLANALIAVLVEQAGLNGRWRLRVQGLDGEGFDFKPDERGAWLGDVEFFAGALQLATANLIPDLHGEVGFARSGEEEVSKGEDGDAELHGCLTLVGS